MTPIQVAIVGAGGQVGPYLLEYLSDDPRIRLRGICRNVVTAGPLRIAGFDVRCGSVADPSTAESLLADCDIIVNCAAASGTATGVQAREQDQAIIRSFAKLAGAKRLIHFSSVGVYGTCLDARRNTFEHPRPDWSYGREKQHLEGYLLRALQPSRHQAVILRMGHVYGAGQWVSRRVLETHKDPQRLLPFDGRLPSNAVHMRNVAAAVRTLVADWAKPGIYNLADTPPSSWRDVFDWNTRAIGAAPVGDMSEEESRRWSEHHRRNAARSLASRLGSELVSWVLSQPKAFITAVPAVKALGVELLEGLRLERLERRAQMQMQRLKVGGALAAPPALTPEAYLFSDGAPGPQLAYHGMRSEKDSRKVAEWYARYSRPEAIWHWGTSDLQPEGV